MTWIKLDDNTTRHPKIAGLSDRAFRVWIAALCYASEFLTDGALPIAFLVTVKRTIQEELISAGLWHLNGDAVEIHDYLEHQTAKEDVEKERARNRKRRGGTAGTTAGTPNGRTEEKPPPEIRRQKTEDRRQKESATRTAPLIMSPLQFDKRRQACAFVGSRLEVPHGLHGDLRKRLGGDKAEFELMAWYEDLNTEIENSGEAIVPDIFKWLNAKFAAWAVKSGEQSVEQIMAEIAKLPKGIGR